MQKIKFYVVFSYLILLCPLGYSQSYINLPTYSGLENDVKFWEKILSVYDYNQCVFHDSWNLSVIYDVVFIGRGSPTQRNNIINYYKKLISQALNKFALGKRPSNHYEKRIYKNLHHKANDRVFLADAASRVRCQVGIKTRFKQSLTYSQKYLPMIKKVFISYNLPIDLIYLPHLESGFNVRAHSKAGARGIWQLMPYTAKVFGLKVYKNKDQRLDPYLATKVAAKILKRNYRQTKSWPLAITAYNYGLRGIMTAIQKHSTTNYMKLRVLHDSKTFGFASRNFYPSFLAVRNLAIKYSKSKTMLLSKQDR